MRPTRHRTLVGAALRLTGEEDRWPSAPVGDEQAASRWTMVALRLGFTRQAAAGGAGSSFPGGAGALDTGFSVGTRLLTRIRVMASAAPSRKSG
jgi:hypothetical protein